MVARVESEGRRHLLLWQEQMNRSDVRPVLVLDLHHNNRPAVGVQQRCNHGHELISPVLGCVCHIPDKMGGDGWFNAKKAHKCIPCEHRHSRSMQGSKLATKVSWRLQCCVACKKVNIEEQARMIRVAHGLLLFRQCCWQVRRTVGEGKHFNARLLVCPDRVSVVCK